MAAMSSGLGSPEGRVTPDSLEYYRARAAGGAGLITVEFTCVDTRYGRAEMAQLALDQDEFIDGHRGLVKAMKDEGAGTALQLHLPGQLADPRTLQGLPSGPSIVLSRRDGTPQCLAFSEEEVHGLVRAFGSATERAVEAGYDAIELHGAHGYLLMAFLSPLKNTRDDFWGGDETRRLNFPLAVIRAVKAALGPDKPLIYRLSSTDYLPGGITLEDTLRIVPRLVAAGVDAIHVSTGNIEGSLDMTIDPMSMPEGWRLDHCRAIRDVAGVPVLGVGPVRWPATGETAIREGALDIVALGRPLLADPFWARKALSGRVKDIRPCTNCNWCFDRILRHETIACAENPVAGYERISRALSGGGERKAIVVGGGPGGMAAALDFAAAGFSTELYETRRELGGGLIASATPPLKDKLFWYLDYLKERLAESAVTVHCGHKLDPGAVVALAPDVVLLATGARAANFPLQTDARARIVSAYDLLMSEADLPPPNTLPVVVYGGGETGCETAEYLTERGYSVVLVTRSPARQLARSAEPMYRKQLRARLANNMALTIVENATIASVCGETVRIEVAAGGMEISCTCVVMAQGRESGTDFDIALSRQGIPFSVVGDAQSIGRIGDAVHAARRAVLHLSDSHPPARPNRGV
ncbi:2,4-dienoyl-CoA reductase-like NADH-dependent reductase (Old Yellow Enzyme family) [Hyphomicrobiales bacterium]|nr:2,4-dienoyl-CoA reductase-like NADH-dependent reductase (Old Yellow Enzyme family) [Hyphomicrobiales bacterium]CAH1687715.1 2,4-dienoyl-CoA reductase-like NADH-dependent reductase (Old Yellow Enzyme family) [Hyphomicrobiales bacterium]